MVSTPSRSANARAESPPPVWLQVRVQISVVAQIHAFFEPLVIEDEGAILRGRGIEKQQPQASSLRAPDRKIKNQAMNRQRRLAPAQIIQPDQTEGENAVGMTGLWRDADGRPRRRALPQQSARIGGRKRVFEIGLGGQLGKFVARGIDGAEIAGTARGNPAGRF